MRNSFTSVPKAPLRGDVVQKKPASAFAALADERVAKQAKPASGGYPNPEWKPPQAAAAKQMAPAQPPQQMKMQQPQTKAPGGMTGDYKPQAKTTGGQPDVRAAALQKFGQSIQDPNVTKKATTPDMAGQKPTRGAYAPKQYPTFNPDDLPDAPKVNMDAVEAYKASIDETKNPGPGYEWDAKVKNPDGSQGRWVKTSLDKMPPGVALDDPGWTWTNGEWVYDPNKAGGAAIDTELAAALKGTPEDYGMSEEMKGKAKQSILNQAAQAKADLSQAMAGRGLGSSGLTGSGFGQIDVGTQMALSDMEIQNWQAGVDNRINELKTLLTARGNELSEKNRREIADQIAELEKAKFEYEQSSQEESDRHTLLNNLIAQLGGEKWAPETLSQAYEMLDAGVSYTDVIKAIQPDSNNKLLLAAAKADAGESDDGDGISGFEGKPATEGEDYVEPDVVTWHSASQADREKAYDEYASKALNAGGVPLGEEDWNLWQQIAYENEQDKQDEEAAQ